MLREICDMVSKKENKIGAELNLDFLRDKKFEFIAGLKKEFPEAEIYLVGGAVRDLLIKRKIKDFDFLVRKIPAKDLKKFLAKFGTVNLVGEHFGVFKFTPLEADRPKAVAAVPSAGRPLTGFTPLKADRPKAVAAVPSAGRPLTGFTPHGETAANLFEIALPRREFAMGTGGYRDFEVQSNPDLKVEEDLSRRDFTVNAMALQIKSEIRNPKSETNSKFKIPNSKFILVDPFDGQKDLEKKLIRAVGKPAERFKEDYSRMLRAIRFACQLDFEIEEKTWLTIKNKIKGINEISREVGLKEEGPIAEQEVTEKRVVPYEVIAREFLKSFIANPVKALDLYDESGAFEELMPEILKMKNCPQPENFHSEGDVWAHTRLALEKLSSPEFIAEFSAKGGSRPKADQPPAEGEARRGRRAGASGGQKQFDEQKFSGELVMAVLFHDLGKPYTIKTPEKDKTDRIRFNEHDTTGGKMARKIAERLKLSSPEDAGIDVEKMAWLVEHHMLLVQGDISQMRPSTIEKYFFNPRYPGDDLLKLSFVDISATIPKVGKSDFSDFKAMLKRIEELKQLSATKKELPAPILNGHEIIEKFNLRPGPKIGELLTLLREEQLSEKIKTKEEAIELLKKKLTPHPSAINTRSAFS